MGGDAAQQFLRVFRLCAGIRALLGDKRRVLPDWQSILAPIERERPARQAFARIPFSLAVMQKPTRCETLAQAADQQVGLFALCRPHRTGVPLIGFEIVDGNEGRFAAHGQPDIMGIQNLIDLLAERIEFVPAFVRKRFGDARRLGNPPDLHVEGEFRVGMAVIAAGNRRGVAVMRCCRQGNMALAGQQTGRGVEADPARTRHINFGPCVQIGEVHLGAGWAVQRLEVRCQLDEISRHETGSEAKMPQDLHEQPAGIAAGPLAGSKRLLRCLDAGFHADDVTDLLLQAGVEADDHVHRLLTWSAVDSGHEGGEQRAGRFRLRVDGEIVAQFLRIVEGPLCRLFLHKEIERIINRHIGDKIDLDLEFAHRFRKNEAGKVITVGILLKVHEVIGG